MRWLVMGAGATGGYVGGRLAAAGIPVTFVARGAHLAALQEHGLRLHSRLGDLHLPVHATDRPADTGPVDVVLFAVKSYDTEAAMTQVADAVGPDTAILCIQNGVDNEERLATRFGAERVLGGAIRIEATIAAPGVIVHSSPFARLEFGPWAGPAGPREQTMLADLTRAGIDAALVEDARRAVWEKFLFLCPAAGVTSVTRATIGEVLSCPESRELFRQAVAEVAAVAAARGVDLGDDAVARTMAFVDGLPPAMRTSMQRDVEQGRRIELDALSGTVVRYGQAAGVPTPAHAFLYAALRPAALAAERAYAAAAR